MKSRTSTSPARIYVTGQSYPESALHSSCHGFQMTQARNLLVDIDPLGDDHGISRCARNRSEHFQKSSGMNRSERDLVSGFSSRINCGCPDLPPTCNLLLVVDDACADNSED